MDAVKGVQVVATQIAWRIYDICVGGKDDAGTLLVYAVTCNRIMILAIRGLEEDNSGRILTLTESSCSPVPCHISEKWLRSHLRKGK